MKETASSVTADSNTLLRRTGWQAIITLVATLLANLAVTGFISFLWFADYDNTLWHRIMVLGWSTRSISISTLVLRFAIDLQAGIAGAMLAALVLESCSVRLRHVVKVSTMRASNPQPRTFFDLVPAMRVWTDARSLGESRCSGRDFDGFLTS